MNRVILTTVMVLSLVGCSQASPQPPVPTPPTMPAPVASALVPIPIPQPPKVTGIYPSSCHSVVVSNKPLPDATCTPGSVNPQVTQATISKTICVRGWTALVRPPESNTAPVKVTAMKAYGMPAKASATTELDHLVPLELGGSDDVSNLWPEPSDLPNAGFRNSKDTVESKLNKAVCQGKVKLDDARQAIATDWPTALQRVGVS